MNAIFSLIGKISWRWNRLRCMSLGEIKARFYNLLKKKALKLGFFSAAKVPPPNLNETANPWIKRSNFFLDAQDYCHRADQFLNHGVYFFTIRKNFDEILDHWNRDPKTGITAPLSFGPSLNCQDHDLVGDIKYLWEPNRHLFLVPIAQAYQMSGNFFYLNSIRTALTTWFEQCPYLSGPNWSSSLELGIRLINWSIIWQLIGCKKSALFKDNNGQTFLIRWMEFIYQHLHFIDNNLSFYSSANNHLIGEAAGLFIGTVTWPFWPELGSIREKAFKILEKEALLQNASDGTNREQAISYQQFVLDFLIMAGLAGRYNGYEFSKAYWQRIESMIAFLGSVLDLNGNVPMIGDSDDGYVSFLSAESDFCNYRSLLATGAVLFNRQDFKLKAENLDHKTCWLTGGKAVEMFTALSTQPTKLPIQREFKEGGYYILGKNFEKENEIRCIVLCGPLGYLSIAAHGHAAALSIYLSVGGHEILIDPGTYTYHGHDKWRHYFRGTSGHCSLTIDDHDQSQSGGKFMWTKHANAHCETWMVGSTKDRFVGYHNGYLRLSDPVIHKREVIFDKAMDRINIIDWIDCKKTHTVKRFWHFSEACGVRLKDNHLIVQNNGVEVEFDCSDSTRNLLLVKGDKEGPFGWISRGFDHKVPCYTAMALNTIKGHTKLSTLIDIKANLLD
jgi:hypothetical protein